MAAEAGLSFREVMAGGFAMGESDPVAGAGHGKRDATRLSMDAQVLIPDLARFVADPEHTGGLDARVSFAPIGEGLAAPGGVVKLFAPTPDPDLKLMVYRVTFTHAGRTYCLDGAKHVRRRRLWHSWTDTTTLFCRLHEGRDPSGPIVGAGTLRLTPLAFLRQLTTFRPLHARSLGARIGALVRFLRFFAGETIDTYLFTLKRRGGQ